ncbi:MAG TPA: type II secretion system protein GspL [Gammaproteobacteria bacterium]|nr:type II secretion system protein GspL [Gammaproteobacteria bacterium]
MAESIYLLLPRDGGNARWLLVDALGNRIGFAQRGPLAEAAVQAPGRRLTALVPGEYVTLLNADIPSKSAQKVLQAAPFMLEDRLAEDVESLHFAAGLHDTGGHLISATTRARMRHWLELLTQAGLNPTMLVPDLCALQPEPETAVAALDDGYALVRFPDGSGYTVEQDLALQLLKRRFADAATPLKRIVLYAPEDAASTFVSALDGSDIAVVHKPLTDGTLPLLAAGLRSTHPLNLLQGPFQVRSNLQEHWRTWRVAAVLLGVCLLLGLVQQVMAYVHLKHQAASLDAEVAQVFSQAMPGSQPQLGGELAQMKSKLKELQGGSDTGSLLPLLDALGEGLTSSPSVQIIGLNFQGGSLQVQLQAADIGALDALKATLARQNGLNVSLDSVDASGSQVTGRIVLSGSPA